MVYKSITKEKSVKGIIIIIVVVIGLLILAYTTLLADGDNFQLEKVTLRANFLISGEHAPYYLGLDKGFYEEEGLDLEIIPGEGSGLAVQLIGTGKETFGLASSEIVLKGRTNGIPIIAVSLVNPKSPVTIISLKESNIKRLTNLYGKKLGVNYKSNTYLQYQALIEKENLDNSQITEVPGSANLESLLSKRVDAILRQTQNEPVTLKLKGYEINEILFEDEGLHFYGTTLIANEGLVKDNPELVKRFVRATIKSWEYALENPEEASEALVSQNTDLEYEISLEQFKKFSSLFDEQKIKLQGFGFMAYEEWDNTQEILYDLKIIENKIDVDSVFTNKFL
jgi:NitT/TauT family transport system substrate-binding protein